jgi:hypothetical protein
VFFASCQEQEDLNQNIDLSDMRIDLSGSNLGQPIVLLEYSDLNELNENLEFVIKEL